MAQRRVVIAGTGSGVGKTTLTIGLMAAFKEKGLEVQGFKCGPDYIDPMYHTAVTGRRSRNLDSWMLAEKDMLAILHRASQDADISIIEGVMGFYDGKSPLSNKGSTAEISMITKSPVVLVVNCYAMARSAAAVVKGFQLLEPKIQLVAVIANQVGSEGHYQLVKAAIEQECKIPVLGYLLHDLALEIPERHLGLIPSVERGDLAPYFEHLGQLVSATIDTEGLYELSLVDEEVTRQIAAVGTIYRERPKEGIRIAVARDAAFNFYYEENLELLEAYGAECVFFSPLAGQRLPNGVHGLYLGGGFPEEFALELSADEMVKESIKKAIEKGLPTFAECGGFMYLTEGIVASDGRRYPMVGVIPGEVQMQARLAALGYREIRGVEGNFLLGPHEHAKGHEYHYSTYSSPQVSSSYAYHIADMAGVKEEGYVRGNLVAGYTHIHFASNPHMVENWLKRCKEWM